MTKHDSIRRHLLTTSYRRRMLDADLSQTCASLTGLVLDLGGERRSRRGRFRPPTRPDLRWFCLNLDPGVAPDAVGDVSCIPLANGCADAIVCSEVLEHVLRPERVIAECSRLLKPGGQLVLSMPFLVRIHADPADYQRFTTARLTHLLRQAGLTVKTVRKQGLYFTVLAEMLKTLIREVRPTVLRWAIGTLMLPVLSMLIWVEGRPRLATSPLISSYTTGFFVIAVRPSKRALGDKT